MFYIQCCMSFLIAYNGLCKNRFENRSKNESNKLNYKPTRLIRTTNKMVFTLCYKMLNYD